MGKYYDVLGFVLSEGDEILCFEEKLGIRERESERMRGVKGFDESKSEVFGVFYMSMILRNFVRVWIIRFSGR